jgi:hypothetical protein
MHKYFTILFLVALHNITKAQSIPEKIVAAIDTFSFIQPQEKTYLQTDRANYLAGEPIWFKAYATLNEKPTILSKIIYIELVNADGKLVDKKMLKLTKGSASGAIDTKNLLTIGTYSLRAYTKWMLNFPEFIIEKKISILNIKNSTKSPQKNSVKQVVNVSFYPEGGNLISNLKSTVAFKATDQHNNPIEIKGNILNSKNEIVNTIATMYNGMGKFELSTTQGETYKAVITTLEGMQKTILLPVVIPEAIVLNVDNSNINKTFVSVTRSEVNKAKYNNLIVVAQINYQVAYIGKLNMDEGLDAVAINKKNLPAGIMQITILSEGGKPLAERIVFVANHSINKDLLTSIGINAEKRKKNSFSINLSTFKNMDAAIAITNASAMAPNTDNNILSTLLLASDLKGEIYNPVAYFENKEPAILNNLDLVMLTNGWRRYNLEEIMANKFSKLLYPFETSISIAGRVLQSDGKSSLNAGKINLMINGEDSTKILSQANTNENSAFIIDKLDYKKEATIFYQGTNLNSTNAIVSVNFMPSFYDTLSKPAGKLNENTFSSDNIFVPSFFEKIITERQKIEDEKGKTLDVVIVKAKKRSAVDSLNALYATDIFLDSDQTIEVNTEINYGDIWQFLRARIPGTSIIVSDSGTQVNFTRYQGLDYFSENGGNTGVQFFLNEVPVNVSVIESLFAEDIGLIKVFKGTTAIALGANRGAIALYTVKGKSTRDWRKKGFDFFKKLGYSADRAFFEMDYSAINPESNFSDIRTTLYWNPNIKVLDGKAIVDFYNDDIAKKFKVVVEGIDEDGKLLHIEKELE